MADWWQWSQKRENEALTFAVVGVGRFGTAVCRELISNGADVLAADYSEKAIDDLRQLETSIEARVVDCTDEEARQMVEDFASNKNQSKSNKSRLDQ